ncbi:MAG: response regulator [Sphingobacteriales bacterium]|nr:MAG: response regulator [Sphingobacteriales bacterium]
MHCGTTQTASSVVSSRRSCSSNNLFTNCMSSSSATRYILYADDDADDREMFETAFHAHPQFVLCTFPDAAALLRFLEEKEPGIEVCLIISDINMPRVSGIELLSLVKAQPLYRLTPFMLLTTAGSPRELERALELRTVVVPKPHTLKGFGELMQLLLKYSG